MDFILICDWLTFLKTHAVAGFVEIFFTGSEPSVELQITEVFEALEELNQELGTRFVQSLSLFAANDNGSESRKQLNSNRNTH